MRYRVRVEARWLIAMAEEPAISCTCVDSARTSRPSCMRCHASLMSGAARRVKDLEAVTQHDVKAVEYYLRERLSETSLQRCGRVRAFRLHLR